MHDHGVPYLCSGNDRTGGIFLEPLHSDFHCMWGVSEGSCIGCTCVFGVSGVFIYYHWTLEFRWAEKALQVFNLCGVHAECSAPERFGKKLTCAVLLP